MMLRPIQYYILYDFIEDTNKWARNPLWPRLAARTGKKAEPWDPQVRLGDDRGTWPIGLF